MVLSKKALVSAVLWGFAMSPTLSFGEVGAPSGTATPPIEKSDSAKPADSSVGTSGQTPASTAPTSGGNRIDQTGFSFDPRTVSPSSFRYDRGSKGNLQMLFEHVSNLLLIAIATLAALLIAVAGLRMAFSSVNPDEAAKGKTMLKFNLMALAVALLSYAIINVVSWIISAN